MKFKLQHKAQYLKNFRLAYPVMLGSLGQTTVNLADSVMVGQTGHIPLAAVSLSNSLFFAPMVFGMGIAFGITPLVANAEGANNHEKSVRVLKNGIIVTFLAGLILGAIVLALTQNMHWMGQNPEVIAAAQPYLYFLIASVVPFMFFMALKQFSEGISDTKAAMRVSLVANLMNVVLNYFLIFGKAGFPEMGLVGAGLSTFISRLFQALALGAWLWLQPRYKLYQDIWRQTVVKFRYIKDVLAIGVPSGLQAIFEVSAFAMASIFMGTIGAEAQAAHQIAISLASMSFMLASGFASAATIRVGNQLGKKDYPQLRLAMRTIFRMVIWLATFSGVIFIVGRHYLPSLFTDDAAVIEIASGLFIVTAIFQLSDCIQVVALGALRGFSDVKMPTLITFLAYWVVALPLAYYLGKHTGMGPNGIWAGLAIGLTVAAGLLWHRYQKRADQLTLQKF